MIVSVMSQMESTVKMKHFIIHHQTVKFQQVLNRVEKNYECTTLWK